MNLPKDEDLAVGLSVILCCYNSAAQIGPTVRALSAQKVPPGCGYEVILVDNNCTDDTVSLAKTAWSDRPQPLRIVREEKAGLIHARRAGVAQARFDIVLFIDDDNLLEGDWLGILCRLYAQMPDTAAIGGFSYPVSNAERPEWFDEFCGVYACTRCRDRSQSSMQRNTLFGAGLSVRTALIRRLFNDSLPFWLSGRTRDLLLRGDDSELCLRLRLMGWKLWYENTLRLGHFLSANRLNWDYVLRCRRGGGHAHFVIKMYRDLLEEGRILPYEAFSAHLAGLWQDFWKKQLDMDDLRRQGNAQSFRYAFLQGLTDECLDQGRQGYDELAATLSIWAAAQRSRD